MKALFRYGLIAVLLTACLAAPAQAQLYNNYSRPSPFGNYGPYITRPFSYYGNLYSPTYTPGYGYRLYSNSGYYSGIYSPYGLGYRPPLELYGPSVYSYYAPSGAPYAYSYARPYVGGGYRNSYGGTATYSYYPPVTGANTPQEKATNVQVKVPSADAEIWFNSTKTKQTGTVREFVTPPLTPGKKYRYQVRVTWKEQGVTVEKMRTITVRAGEDMVVDFTSPEVSENE